ncbi:protein hunchback-like [Parasteatoda tepidariorum]|uniref:Protein hunchback n=1 Tax=Parasteatoda tepidariorum TaxID=114398 RepID=C8Z2G2_PARTP|nr:protein hunchback-like [Parasteatoda tepidariorum]CAX11339.1 hunchback [Parasteatoda tepidariorum]
MSVECQTRTFIQSSNNPADLSFNMAPLGDMQQDMQKHSESVIYHPHSAKNCQSTPVSSPMTSMGSGSSPRYTEDPMSMEDNLDPAPIDLSSDDSCLYSEDEMQNMSSNPLNELQNSLDKNGFLGQSLSARPNGTNGRGDSAEDSDSMNKGVETLECHLCNFQAVSPEEYSHHIDGHFDHKCPICDYTSRTEGRLNRHIQDFHSEVPPESWAGKKKPNQVRDDKPENSSSSSPASQKAKINRCKQCNFSCDNKPEYYKHLQEVHMKKDKILQCPNCCFVTEYKHHFEYHLRNHVGSKPFRCDKCNYSCVNKSMLNSHEKSHSKIYPYRCANCKYATKYCHSLKMHLRKYGHSQGQILNPDGTPNHNPIIDVHGRRRGPKGKSGGKNKQKCLTYSDIPSPNICNAKTEMSTQPFLYPTPHFPPKTFSSMLMGPTSLDLQIPSFSVWPRPFKCHYCDFMTESLDLYQQHAVAHAVKENSDLMRTCNINPDIFHLQAQHLTFNNYPQNSIHHVDEVSRSMHKNEIEKKIVCSTASENARSHSIHSENAIISTGNSIYSSSAENKIPLTNSVPQIPDSKTYSPVSISSDGTKNISDNHKPSSDYPEILPRYSPPARHTSPVHFSTYNENGNNHTSSDKQSLTSPQEALSISECSPKSSSFNSDENARNSFECQNEEHSPLDLSGPKISEPISRGVKIEHHTAKRKLSPNDVASTNQDSQSRNRRKGKAFKLDHYIQCEDSPIKTDLDAASDFKYFVGSEDTAKREASQLLDSTGNRPKETTPEETPKQYMQNFNQPPKTTASSKSLEKEKLVSTASSLSTQRPLSPEFTINHNNNLDSSNESDSNIQSEVPKVESDEANFKSTNGYACKYCEMTFMDCAMYTMHMGYHGLGHPYRCNTCGSVCQDKVEFFLHLIRVAHT